MSGDARVLRGRGGPCDVSHLGCGLLCGSCVCVALWRCRTRKAHLAGIRRSECVVSGNFSLSRRWETTGEGEVSLVLVVCKLRIAYSLSQSRERSRDSSLVVTSAMSAKTQMSLRSRALLPADVQVHATPIYSPRFAQTGANRDDGVRQYQVQDSQDVTSNTRVLVVVMWRDVGRYKFKFQVSLLAPSRDSASAIPAVQGPQR